MWLVGDTTGVTFTDSGWMNFRFWPLMALLLGVTVGFAAGALLALHVVQRSPRLVGGVVVGVAALTTVALVADTSGWDWLYFFVPGFVAAVGLAWLRTRRADHEVVPPNVLPTSPANERLGR